MDEAKQRFAHAMAELRTSQRRWAATPVDVRATPDDSELDSHLSIRLQARVGDDALTVSALSDELRAYYVTRFFEREYASGGITGFLDWGSSLGPLVAEGYRRLGLHGTAAAFDQLWSSRTLKRLATDDAYEPSEDEEAELFDLGHAVGEHDDERIAYVRRYPDVFSV
jgi:hypothetical protein